MDSQQLFHGVGERGRRGCLVEGCPCKDARIVSTRRAAFFGDQARQHGETAARAIVWVAEHPRRELLLGWPTFFGVLGQRLAPGLMDRYLARSAWEGQMSEDPARPGAPDNLEGPVRADVGAHGAFDDLASDDSPWLWAEMQRGVVAGAAVAAAATVVGLARLLRRG